MGGSSGAAGSGSLRAVALAAAHDESECSRFGVLGTRAELALVCRDAVSRQVSTDRRLTKELKGIVAADGWPTDRMVGAEASGNAALMLIHSRDHDFHRSLLPELQRLAEAKEIKGSDIALLTDKLLLFEGKPQRFGTQFKVVGDHLELSPVEDLASLDRRRVPYLLPPMAEYRKQLAEAYHMPVR